MIIFTENSKKNYLAKKSQYFLVHVLNSHQNVLFFFIKFVQYIQAGKYRALDLVIK